MKSLFLLLISILSLTASAFDFGPETFGNKTFTISSDALTPGSHNTTLVFQTDANSNITSLKRDHWPWLVAFYDMDKYSEEEMTKDIISDFGFYNNVPADFLEGSCQADSCKIQVFFSDEECTTLYIHFDYISENSRGEMTISGKIFETHSDQGITFKDDTHAYVF